MHCFSCGFKGNLFTHFGAPESPLEVKIHRIKDKIAKARSQTVGIQLPEDRIEWKGGPYCNISETLKIWKPSLGMFQSLKGGSSFPFVI